MTRTFFDTATLPVTPWKNGGGTTREIVRHPAGAGADGFAWRVSIATIAAGGPFSVFGGKRRVIMLLAGDGVRLQAPGFDHRLAAPHVPFEFAGDAAVQCTLLGGTSTDFNLMFDPARCTASLQVLDAARALPASRGGMVLALRGTCACAAGVEGDASVLAADEGLWWTGERPAFAVAPRSSDARLAVVLCGPEENFSSRKSL
ncbi:HutD/Ves family protein [Xylophilus ampelinus]|uniref:HutD protein n=1 Tax=Xylophilus ampelinus TaxID=54067 RepID=A0A318SFU5_9BURK|nr:HutD family protein [Xylophilus ampelinus]MCS4510695.1 HutD family protein [Xylophilus ampelinus]PYE76386.1 hypothetical protein DFQ15_11374 [Xylophilus ampelinus]